MSLTVLIPTANRAGMLREALASVARQTALSRISTVHVSENAGQAESESVCREFPGLPIRYTRRAPPLATWDHAIALINEVETEYAAILHDDDWWAPHHVQASLDGLEAASGHAASYSAFFEPYGTSFPLYCDNSLMCWSAAGYPALTGHWTLTLPEVVLASLTGTPFRYSTLMVRSSALRKSAFLFSLGNPFDTDRMLGISLSEHGNLIYQPVPSVFIRMHPGQDARNFDQAKTHRHMLDTTRWMLDRLHARGLDLKSLLATRLADCPSGHKLELLHRLRSPCCLEGLREKDALPSELDRFDSSWRKLRTARFAKELVPPLFVNAARRLAARLSAAPRP